MICPKCGNEIAEGHLYCEVCGEEIQIVPDFDLQVEESIHVTLSSVAGDVKAAPVVDAEGITKEIPTELIQKAVKEEPKNAEREKEQPRKKKPQKKPAEPATLFKNPTMWLVVSGIAVFVLVIVLVVVFTSPSTKAADPYETALAYYQKGEYALAVEKLEAMDRDGTASEQSTLLLSDCYTLQQQYEESINLLNKYFQNDPENTGYLKRMLENYIALDDKEAIKALLSTTGNETILQDFSDYIANPPLFSLESGTYTDDEQLSIVSEAPGEIRYTLDGSIPDQQSLLYQKPFVFDIGEHTVTAIFINENGMVSDSVQNVYEIEKKMLDDPVLLTEGGQYTDPELIRLEKPVGAVIYYTDDGSDPTVESNVYNQPIPMPIKDKTYRFIMIDPDGLTSQIIEAEYSLQMATLIDVTMAENAVQLCLTIGGKGVKQSEYKCSSALRVNDKNYYLVEEYSLQTSEKVKTGRVYAVDVLTGELYKVDMSSAEGDYQLTPFNG